MNRYLAIAAGLLALIAVSQAITIHRLSDFSDLQGRIIDDYWDMLKACNKETK